MKYLRTDELAYIKSSDKILPTTFGIYNNIPVTVRRRGVVNLISFHFLKAFFTPLLSHASLVIFGWFILLMAIPYTLIKGNVDEIFNDASSIYVTGFRDMKEFFTNFYTYISFNGDSKIQRCATYKEFDELIEGNPTKWMVFLISILTIIILSIILFISLIAGLQYHAYYFLVSRFNRLFNIQDRDFELWCVGDKILCGHAYLKILAIDNKHRKMVAQFYRREELEG